MSALLIWNYLKLFMSVIYSLAPYLKTVVIGAAVFCCYAEIFYLQPTYVVLVLRIYLLNVILYNLVISNFRVFVLAACCQCHFG